MGNETILPACPACGSTDVKPIVYGYPGLEMLNDPTIALGGCCIFEDSPAFVCDACEHAWGKRVDA